MTISLNFLLILLRFLVAGLIVIGLVAMAVTYFPISKMLVIGDSYAADNIALFRESLSSFVTATQSTILAFIVLIGLLLVPVPKPSNPID